MPDQRTIVAMGGGGFTMEPEGSKLDDWILTRAEVEEPSICFLPTASGDASNYIEEFYRAFGDRPCRPTHLNLFTRRVDDLREFLLRRDIIYVGGGNTANMLQVWRVHGLDEILREVWEAGVALCGLSAGSLCWYECGVTDSFGTELAPLHDGLGFLSGSHCPHYDGEEDRRPTYESLVADGALPGGIAADDGVAVCYRGTEVSTVVRDRRDAFAWRVEPAPAGEGVEQTRVTPDDL